MKKVISKEQALDMLKPGQTLMIGGFATVGTPLALIEGIVERKIGALTIISNDTGWAHKPGNGQLIVNKLVKKAIVSHIGTNPETVRQYQAGEIELEFIPQGTLAERIRCGGTGIGGFYTPTGVGTIIGENKERKTINGKSYILETGLRAEIALVKAWKADTAGNLIYRRTARNFNPLMATAADLVIVEAEEIVNKGALDPDQISTPGIYVDYIVKG